MESQHQGVAVCTTDLLSIVAVVYGPPPPGHLVVRRLSAEDLPSSSPGLVGTNKMHHIYARLEVLIGRDVLVMGRWGDVVREAEAVVVLLEIHVQESLVGAVKGDAALGHGHQGVIIA